MKPCGGQAPHKRRNIVTKVILKLREWLFSRVVVVGLLIVIQIALLTLAVLRLSRYFAVFYGIFMLLSVIMTLAVIDKEENPSYKLAWVIPIMAFPLFGGFFYLMFGNPRLSHRLSERLTREQDRLTGTDAALPGGLCPGGRTRRGASQSVGVYRPDRIPAVCTDRNDLSFPG